MQVVAINEKGSFLTDGEPSHYVTNSDFMELLNNEEMAINLYKELGQSLCVAALGDDKMDGIFRDAEIDLDMIPELSGTNFTFYEKVD